MKVLLLVIVFMVTGCSLDNIGRRETPGKIGVFPGRSKVFDTGSDRQRTKEMRRDIISGKSPEW